MAHELQDEVVGQVQGQPSPQIIPLFESMGVRLEDIAAAQLVYREALGDGLGQGLTF